MKKRSLTGSNRDKLIDATRAVMGLHGLSDLTVAQVSKHAGISAGFVHYYFGGKEGLLAATMVSLAQAMRARIVRDLANCSSPAGRLKALVRANFDPDVYTPDNCRTWVEFWSRTQQIPAFAKLEKIDSSRSRSNFRHALRQLVSAKEAEIVTEELFTMIIGLWIRRSQSDPHAGPAAALSLTLGHLNRRALRHGRPHSPTKR